MLHALKEKIVFSDCTDLVKAEIMFGLSNAKRFSMVPVKESDKSFSFTQMLLLPLFHCETWLKYTPRGEVAFVR